MGEKCLFVCASNYCLLNCINIALSGQLKYSQYDLIVPLRNNSMNSSIEHLKRESVFGEIRIIKNISEQTAFQRLLMGVFPRYELNNSIIYGEKISNTNQYSMIITQAYSYGIFFSKVFDCKNVYLLDEGLSSYTGDTLSMGRRSAVTRVYSKIKYGNMNLFKGQFLNNIKLYCGEDSGLVINEIDSKHDAATEMIRRVFPLEEDFALYNKPYIYLGTPVDKIHVLLADKSMAGNGFSKKCIRILKDVFGMLGENNIHYRMHPNENTEDVSMYSVSFSDSSSSWERLCNEIDIENIVLISFFSTAAFTPKLLYDKEPVIVFLFQLTGEEFYNANTVIEQMKKNYSDPRRIIVPKSIDELDSLGTMFANKI